MKKILKTKLLELRRDVFKPKPKMSLIEWSESYRVLPSYSAIAGKFKVSTVNVWSEIYDSIHTSKNITVVSPTQVGKSEFLNNIIGYYVHQNPSTLALLMPNEKLLEAMNIRIDSMFTESHELKNVSFSGDKFSKQFSGGQLYLLSARSPSDLSSKPIKIALADEVSRFPSSSGGEGDPLSLLAERQSTYHDSLNIAVSSPTNKGMCRISQRFEESTQEEFNAKCVHCNEHQPLLWENVHIDEDNPENSCYVCSHCSVSWTELDRINSVRAGKFIAKYPERMQSHRGFHFNQLVSPFQTVVQLVEKYLLAKKSTETLKTFVNTSLAEQWQDSLDVPDYERLFERRVNTYSIGSIPNDSVNLITVGVDVQGNRLEAHVVGFNKLKQSFSIEYKVFHGETNSQAPFDELKSFILNKKYKYKDQKELSISMTFIDSGFNTSRVYEFVQQFSPSKVRAIKGSDSLNSPFKIGSDLPNNKNYLHKLVLVGSSFLKEDIYEKLKIPHVDENIEGVIYFPEYDIEFFKGMCGEALTIKNNKKHWVKVFDKNEPLDTFNYAYAAAIYSGLFRFSERDWDTLETQAALTPIIEGETKKTQKPRMNNNSSLWKHPSLQRR